MDGVGPLSYLESAQGHNTSIFTLTPTLGLHVDVTASSVDIISDAPVPGTVISSTLGGASFVRPNARSQKFGQAVDSILYLIPASSH